MIDLHAMAFQEECGMTSAAARFRDICRNDPAIARHINVESIDEAIRDLQEARVYVVNARELARVA